MEKEEKVLEYSSFAFCDGKERCTLWADVWSIRVCSASQSWRWSDPEGMIRRVYTHALPWPLLSWSKVRAPNHAFGSAHLISVAVMPTRALATGIDCNWSLENDLWRSLTYPQRQVWPFPQLYRPELVRNSAFSSIYQKPNAHLITFISKSDLEGRPWS